MIKLKYVGTGQYIMMIPMRDITDYDIETIIARSGESEEVLIETLIKSKLYIRSDEYPCAECGKVFKSWAALNKHELKHVETLSKAIEDSNNGNSANSIKETDTDR